MSMVTTVLYGYGFICNYEDNKLIDFLKRHNKIFCQFPEEYEIYNDIINYPAEDINNIFADYYDECGTNGKNVAISNIMSRETGIRFECCPPSYDYNDFVIIFREQFPWNLNEIEKNLTKENLEEIMKRYMHELGITTEVDYMSMEYYG